MLQSYSQFAPSFSNSINQRKSCSYNWYFWWVPIDVSNCCQKQGLRNPSCLNRSAYSVQQREMEKQEWEVRNAPQCVIGQILYASLVAHSILQTSSGHSLGQTYALMPFLLWNIHAQSPGASSQMPIKDNEHSNIKSSLSWWLYPTDNGLAISDKWLEQNCLAKCKYAYAEMENYHKIFRTAGNFKANLCIQLKLQSPC